MNSFQNKILITAGCSFTGGGNFDNETFFIKEFPELEDKLKSKMFPTDKFRNDILEYKQLYREYLWPSKLGNLLNVKKVNNVAGAGKGVETSLHNLYTSIFKELDLGVRGDDIIIVFQIPSFFRKEVYINQSNSFNTITTEIDDADSNKVEYINRFYNEVFLYRHFINQLYIFKRFCKSLNINLFCWLYEDIDLKHPILYKEFKKKLEYQLSNINNLSFNQLNLIQYRSFDNNRHIDIDEMIDYIDCMDFDKMSMWQYGETHSKDFTFTKKYSGEIVDNHPTKDGNDFIAQILYKKII